MRDWELIGRICELEESDLKPETLRALLLDACAEIVRLHKQTRDLGVLLQVERTEKQLLLDMNTATFGVKP